MEGEGEKG